MHALQPQLVNVMAFTHWTSTASSVCRLPPMHSRDRIARLAAWHTMLIQLVCSSTSNMYMDRKRSHLVARPDVGDAEHELQVAVAARHHRRVRQEDCPPLRSTRYRPVFVCVSLCQQLLRLTDTACTRGGLYR